MIPCLYQNTETTFTTNGIGKLCDSMSARVVEKRNGSYELKLTYPSDGLHAEELLEGCHYPGKTIGESILTQPSAFTSITTPLTGILEIAARHIQYQEKFHYRESLFCHWQPGGDSRA